ncbi:family 20 glycosylhydrolase [Pontibacter liquoris]|uniref:family 20 glycosylhydrolase n=1 Tax=Pontibacter liquoris TaxID=2905677 RepID=UPI001FA79248|nr:family 20 glycosylhydrolase [Pontibacter liquoris]
MKHLLLVILLFVSFGTLLQAQTKKAASTFDPATLKITWELVDNSSPEQTVSALTLANTGKQALPASGWSLYFHGSGSAKSKDGQVNVMAVNGDLLKMVPTASFKSLPAGESRRLEFVSRRQVLNTNDTPEGFYLVWDSNPSKGIALPATVYTTPDREKNAVLWKSAQALYEQNKTIEDIPLEKLPKVFPTPTSYSETGKSFALTAAVPIVAEAAFKGEATLLANYLETVFGKKPAVQTTGTGKAVRLEKKEGLGPEAYELKVTADAITISGTTPAGIFYGIQSLKTLIPPAALASPQQSVAIAGVSVQDAPRFGHRAFMLDVARNFHPKQEVLKLLDLMALYKLNVFHFHMSDDEGWRLEIPALPELTQVGAKRGHTLDNKQFLQPSYGSGPSGDNKSGSGYFSKADFIEILKYANDRHIRVIPEIETPGHARAAIKAMDARYDRLMKEGKKAEAERYLLRDLNDKSVYKSVQNWNDNVIDVAQPSTYNFLETVVDEILKMYKEAGAPIQTIHFGGDEVPGGVWQKSPAVQALIKSNPKVKNTDDLWFYFYGNVNDMLKKRNLYLSGWEEIGLKKVKENGRTVYVPNPQFANENFHVDVWNNLTGAEDLAYKLANAGYKVVLTNVTNLYFDLASQKDYDEPGLYWGGYVDVDKPFYFIPYDYLKNTKEDSRGEPVDRAIFKDKVRLTEAGKANIVGIQAPLWSETVRNNERLEFMILPKLLGLAERAWASDPAWATESDEAKSNALYGTAWSEFVNVVGKRELPRLDKYAGGFNYRIPAPGAMVADGKVHANQQLPGLTIRYTTDGTEPSAKSPEYKAPITANGTVKLRAFTTTGRGGKVTIVNTKK